MDHALLPGIRPEGMVSSFGFRLPGPVRRSPDQASIQSSVESVAIRANCRSQHNAGLAPVWMKGEIDDRPARFSVDVRRRQQKIRFTLVKKQFNCTTDRALEVLRIVGPDLLCWIAD